MRNPDVWQTYRAVFEDFSRKAQHAQSLNRTHDSDPAAIELALTELERARLDYNLARDAVAQELLPSLPAQERRAGGNVQGIAQLLWEGAGQPEGTAHEDWLRAEKIVRRAVA